MGNKKIFIGVCIVLIAVIVLTIWWYLSKDSALKVETTEEALKALSETPQVIIETNPVKSVPNLNPVENTNPFKTSNPFE